MSAQEWVSFAERLAREAGEIVAGHVGQAFDVRRKGAIDLVTEADRASEVHIVSSIRAAYPDHSILAEEGGGRDAVQGASVLWVVDPLDGTTNFAHGLPIWSVSIGVIAAGVPTVGVVYDPSRDECFSARRGAPAHCNGREIRVSDATRLEDALLVTGFPYDVQTSPVNNLDHFQNFMMRARAVRRLGSAAIDLCYVAAGRFDGFWELKLSPWDVAAGVVIVESAGGRVTRFGGEAADIFGKELVAAPSALLEPMISVLSLGQRP